MGAETELKLELPEGPGRLLSEPWLRDARCKSQDQVTTYFDLPDRGLRKLGYSLRVRSVGGRFIQTVKSLESGAGLFQRGEWDYEIQRPEVDPERLRGTPLADVDLAGLEPIVCSKVERTACRLDQEGSRLELAIDLGSMRSGKRETPIRELEIELIHGDPNTVFAVARRVAAMVPVELGVLTKAERGFALADRRLGKVAKAEPVPAHSGMTVADGFATIVSACLRHFRLNAPIVVERRQPEALHQARVAMRRLRSAFTLFRDVIADVEFERLREELRWFTGELGEARNLDVVLDRELAPDERAAMEQRRQQAYDRVVGALESRPVRTLMLDLLAWSVAGEWRGRPEAGEPLGPYTVHRIDRLWHRIAHAKKIGAMEEEQRHRLRIEIKKLRYALEFVEALHAQHREAQKRFAKTVEELQEALGCLNDLAVARTLVAADSWPIEPYDADECYRALITDAEDALHHLKRIGPYWRDVASGNPGQSG